MANFRFVCLGVGNAFSELYYSSCLALEAGGAWILLDCPHPIFKILREGAASAGVSLDIRRLQGLVLTHLHADHCSGVEGLAFYFHFTLKRKLPLITHADVAADLWPKHLAAGMEQSRQENGSLVRHRFEDFFELIPIAEDVPQSLGPFTLHCRKTIHNVPTIALRIAAAGRTLGCSADTAFDPTLIDWLSPADLIVHEAGGPGLHTPYKSLASLPAPLRQKMRLIHYPDDFDLRASTIEPLQQGRLYAL